MRPYFLLIIAALYLGCSNSGTTGPVQTNSDDYFPLTKGSSWTYTKSGSTYTIAIMGDSVFNGNTYMLLSNTDTAKGGGMYRKSGTQVFIIGFNSSLMPADIIFLDTKANATWGNDYNIFGSTVSSSSTNVEQNLTKIVQGKSYSNVIHVHSLTKTSFLGTTDSTVTDMYFAKGIGMIENDEGGAPLDELVSYTIK